MSKHAYLIMAHHRLDLLKRLVRALDHENNDIYIHLDIKCKEPISEIIANCSKIIWIPRIDVRWAGYSQIRCEIELLKTAVSSGNNYQYYHLMTGASYPIKTQKYIFDFFDRHYGKEFVGFVRNPVYAINRVAYYHLFNEVGKPTKLTDYAAILLRNCFVRIQRLFNVNRFERYNMIVEKGLSYWSITEPCARYILKNEDKVKQIFKHSILGDEVFVQTLVYNSNLRDQIYNVENEYKGALFCAGWGQCVSRDRKGQAEPNLIMQDYGYFDDPEFLYALKFEGLDGAALLDRIDNEILKKKE